jgi:hypothetical protein
MCSFHVDSDTSVSLACGTLDVFAVEDEMILVNAASLEHGHGSDRFAQTVAGSKSDLCPMP